MARTHLAAPAGTAYGSGFQVGQIPCGAAGRCWAAWRAGANRESGDRFPAADSGVADQETEAIADRGGPSRPEGPAETGGAGGEIVESNGKIAFRRNR